MAIFLPIFVLWLRRPFRSIAGGRHPFGGKDNPLEGWRELGAIVILLGQRINTIACQSGAGAVASPRLERHLPP
ncbi:MAG: hypothetical protein M0006_02970 [Magnetospirillum sp.]|nr:hypothetical protein [Magnetospirillum sp.]